MTGLLALTMAHAKQFFRVRQEVFLAFAFPVFIMLVLGIVLSNVPDIGNVTNEGLGLSVGVIVPDRTPRTEAIVAALERVSTFRLVHTDEAEGVAHLESGDFAALIGIPVGGAEPAVLHVRYNKTRTQRSRVVLNRLHVVAAELNAELLGHPLPLTTKILGIGAEDDYSSYIEFFIPGVVAMAVFPGVVFSLTPTLVSHRERGVLRRLWLTPAPKRAYVCSHVLFRLGLALLQAVVILLTAALVFRQPFHYGSLRLLLLCVCGALAGCGFAFLLGSIARTQAAGVTLGQITMIPMLLSCGAFFPLELMPTAALPVIRALPLTPLVAALRGVMNFDYPLSALLPAAVVLLSYAVGTGALGLYLFRWESR